MLNPDPKRLCPPPAGNAAGRLGRRRRGWTYAAGLARLGLAPPYGGRDFLSSAATSDISAAPSGVMLQAAMANNINRIAKVKALTLAAR